jgi:hypothetical protein
MSSSASSSESVSSSTSPLSNFDPFAVHPFTSYTSSNPNNNAQLNYDRSNASSCRFEDCPTPHAPQPTTPISSHQQSSPKPYAYKSPRSTGIFVPFRQETSSPDLSDLLKSKSEPPITKSSKTHPKPDKAILIPAAPIGLSSSQKR